MAPLDAILMQRSKTGMCQRRTVLSSHRSVNGKQRKDWKFPVAAFALSPACRPEGTPSDGMVPPPWTFGPLMEKRTHPPKPLNDAQTWRLLALKVWWYTLGT